MDDIFRIRSISQLHQILGLPFPSHPLVSFIDDSDIKGLPDVDDDLYEAKAACDMYTIMFKDKISGSMGYGRSTYDFQEGTIIFMGPGQVYTSPSKDDLKDKKGWTLFFHPDLIRKSELGAKMNHYTFFSYHVNEALHVSAKEEKFVYELALKIQEEYSQNIDQHSQTLIISTLELLLNYCMRFYDRQFYTRTNIHKDFVADFDLVLKNYFASNKIKAEGLPTASYFGKALNMSPNYLSDMLKKETGKRIKEHIDGFIVEKAKSVLLNSNRKVSEIAYDLGFDYPQSFSRLFKNKTGVSPAAYRSLN